MKGFEYNLSKKFYAVKNGRHPGIYTSWDDCKREVTGYKDAQFKGFMTREEAKAYLTGSLIITTEATAEAVAYIDGSFDVKQNRFSFGAVLFYNGKELHFSESFGDSALSSMRNVAGEIKGAAFVMEYCVEHNISSLDLYYDYAGIEHWCTGAWKAEKEGTKNYALLYRKLSQSLTVNFHKVKGHSGNTYNDLADKLAKKALGLA